MDPLRLCIFRLYCPWTFAKTTKYSRSYFAVLLTEVFSFFFFDCQGHHFTIATLPIVPYISEMIPVGFTADGSMKYTISGYFAEVFANLQVSDAALKEVISDSNNRLFVCNRGDTVEYHGGLRSRELGQASMLQVFLTPRQALSSHPRQQMV